MDTGHKTQPMMADASLEIILQLLSEPGVGPERRGFTTGEFMKKVGLGRNASLERLRNFAEQGVIQPTRLLRANLWGETSRIPGWVLTDQFRGSMEEHNALDNQEEGERLAGDL